MKLIDHHTLSNADSESQDEIVKNAENNLVYTVLNPKKSSSVVRPNHNPKYQESDFIKVFLLASKTKFQRNEKNERKT